MIMIDFGAAHRKGRKEQRHYGTRMTRIQRIFTYPCESAQSVFSRSCSCIKSNDREISVSIFQNYETVRHELTSINYVLPLEGV